ncbi:hypothetical protein VPH35_059175 [Triticum aestivum]|uniref:Uncharacterized protein n=1 Tax=Aegilops tauschii TaxID=37682 RepID=M8C177_AEGTA
MATIAFRLLSRRTLTSAIGKAAEHLPQVNCLSSSSFFNISFRIETQKLRGLWQGRWSWRSYLLGFDDTAMAEAKRRLGHASYMKLLEKEQAAVDRTLGRLVFGSAVVSVGLLLAKIYPPPPASGHTITPTSDGV